MATTEPGEQGFDSLLPKSAEMKRALDDLKSASTTVSKQKKEFGHLDKFFNGRQWKPQDEQRLMDEDRPTAIFNFAQKYIRIVAGSEQSNRQEVIFVARMPEAQLANARGELSTAIYQSVLDACNGPDERSQSFADLLVRGMGWCSIRLDMDIDGDGQIIVERVDGMKMSWDPAARKQNLEDARWVACEEEIPLREAMRKWPDKKAELQIAEMLKDEAAGPDGKDVEHVTPIEYDPINETPGATLGGSPPTAKGYVRITEYQWYESETEYQVLDTTSGKIQKLDSGDFDRLKRRLTPFGVNFVGKDEPRSGDGTAIRYAKRDKRVYKRVFLAGTVELEKGELPVQGVGFTYKAMTGHWDAAEKLWRGLLHVLLDPQVFANKFFSTLLHIINANAKGGLMAEATVFADPVKAEQDWANPQALILLQDGALSGDKPRIQERSRAEMPPGIFQLWQACVDSLGGVSGINPELLGSTTGDVPGVAQRQRQLQGMTINANYFSALTRYLRNEARTVMEFIREYIADGRLMRIGGPFNSQAIPLLREHLPIDYDLVIDEPTRSPNAKEVFWEKMAPVLPMLVRTPGLFVPEILDYSPFPASIAAKIKQRISQMEQKAAQTPPMPPKGAKDPRETEAKIQSLQAQAQLTTTRARVLEQEAGIKRGQAALAAIGQAQDIGQRGAKGRLEHAAATQDMIHGAQRHSVSQLQETLKLLQPGMPAVGER